MMTRIASLLRFASLAAVALGATGCAYHLGAGSRSLPGGYRQMSIPIFKNRSQEVGAEVAFTQALQQEFRRSNVARVVDDPLAEVRIEGEVSAIDYIPESKRTAGSAPGGFLPEGTVIASRYTIQTVVQVSVVRRSDGEKLWAGSFRREKSYEAPLVTLSGVNTVNPLYNLSARRQTIELLANEMMVEAHSRITENF